jgi:hypothetical protein
LRKSSKNVHFEAYEEEEYEWGLIFFNYRSGTKRREFVG